MSALRDVPKPEVKSDLCELAPHKKFLLDSDARKYVRKMGLRSGFEHLICYCGRTGQVQVRWSDREVDTVKLPEKYLKRAKARGNRLVIHHNHPGSMSLSRADVAHLVERKGMIEVFAHAHDGSWYWAESRKKRNAADMVHCAYVAMNKASLYVSQRYNIAYDEALAPHLVNVALDRVGAIRYRFELSPSILAYLGQIPQAQQDWFIKSVADATRKER
jgi:hypothetical protein